MITVIFDGKRKPLWNYLFSNTSVITSVAKTNVNKYLELKKQMNT